MRVVVLCSLLCLALGACSTDELARSAYASAKAGCRLNPAHCTVHPDGE